MSGHGEGTSRPQNVKPKPPQNEQNRKEDVKKDKPPKARRSRSTDSERGGSRGRTQDRDWHRSSRRPRGRSEEGRGPQRPQENDLEDLECAVCFCSYDNVFKTPKLLACGHTFCLECLARINVTSAEIKTLTCPVCRKLTELPHGRDLPRLGNNQDIIGKLPAEMQRAFSIRFKRSKGKLMLKHPPPNNKTSLISLPKKPDTQPPAPDASRDLAGVELGAAPANMVDVGRPPNRMHGRLRRLFHSDNCYYAVVASIITITVTLMLVGILAFVIIPRGPIHPHPPAPGGPSMNQTSSQENDG